MKQNDSFLVGARIVLRQLWIVGGGLLGRTTGVPMIEEISALKDLCGRDFLFKMSTEGIVCDRFFGGWSRSLRPTACE